MRYTYTTGFRCHRNLGAKMRLHSGLSMLTPSGLDHLNLPAERQRDGALMFQPNNGTTGNGPEQPPEVSCCLVDLGDEPLREVRRMVDGLGIEVVEVPEDQAFDRPLDDLRGNRPSFVMLVLDSIGTVQLAAIRQVRALTAMPIVVVSRMSTPETRIAAFEAGADEHLSPTVEREELAARIKAKLRRSRSTFEQP